MITKALLAFVLGGFLCLVAQILIDKTSLSPAKILVSYVVFGVFLGAVGIYRRLFDVFGCGASLPLIGFGGNVAEGVKEAVSSHGFFGALKGAFTASSAGISVSLICALITALIFDSKSKKL